MVLGLSVLGGFLLLIQSPFTLLVCSDFVSLLDSVLVDCIFLEIYKFLQFSSVAQSCPTLCDPMNCSTPGLPVHHQLLEFTQTHVRQVGNAIQPSHPLSSPSPLAPNPSQYKYSFKSSRYMFVIYYCSISERMFWNANK